MKIITTVGNKFIFGFGIPYSELLVFLEHFC